MRRLLTYILASVAALLLWQVAAMAQDVRDTTSHVIFDLELIDSADSTVVEAPSQQQIDAHKKTKKEINEEVESMNFPDLYLDTVVVKRKNLINDYSMIGIQYGAGVSQAMFNPSRSQKFTPSLINFGIMYTKYGKMFGFMPYFGLQVGAFYETDGYKFKKDKETGYVYTEQGADRAQIHSVNGAALAQFHFDFWKMKILANLGYYAGYRLDITRYGETVVEEYKNSFTDYDKRFDYGIKGGAGFAFVFDPVEIHIQATYKQSLQSLYNPDYYSPYYYRFAYPYTAYISVGLHFQLSRRTGKTHKELKEAAKAALNIQDNGNQSSQNRQ